MEDEEEDEDEVGGTKLMMLVIKTKFMFALYLQFRHLIKICQISLSLCALLASLEASSWKRKTQTLQPSSVAVFLSGRAFTS